jgi:IS1 family transposase
MWTYVGKKAAAVWIWLAVCRRTRQVVGWVVGARDELACRELRYHLDAGYGRCRTVSDGCELYLPVFGRQGHACCTKQSGETAHVERKNNVLRQRLACLVRKTLAFAKCIKSLVLRLYVFLLSHNREFFISHE